MKLAVSLFALSLFGATYEVGPGKQFTDPVALPWGQLTDGDTIRVYYRAEPPTPPPTTPPPTTTTPQSTPASTALEATIAQLKALLEKAAGLQKAADDAAKVAAAAITEAKASALNTGDATSDAVIGNMRTRLGEVITALQNLGLLN